MIIYPYKNYKNYVVQQRRANKKKRLRTWAQPGAIANLANSYLRHEHLKNFDKTEKTRILCHGTRNGKEMHYWRNNFPNAFIIGTDISMTCAAVFPFIWSHDMQDPHPYLKDFNIVYSNSFDHVIYPEKTAKTWIEQCVPGMSRICLEVTPSETRSPSISDPLTISEKELISLFCDLGATVDYLLHKRANNDNEQIQITFAV